MSCKLPNEVESFLAKDHLLFRFKMEEKRDMILHDGPWVVTGKLLAIESWVLDFVPGSNIIKKTTVCLHFPGLLIEF